MNVLTVLATPLGNLSDLSARAVETLARADVVFAEDTRVTQTLLQHVGSKARCVSLHAHNEAERSAVVAEALASGQRCVLVSDAGTPAISDPGARAVAAVVEAGFSVTSIPGPSAVTTALAASGFPAVPFAFFGFLERERQPRMAQLAALRGFIGTAVLFETKERIADTLAELRALLGEETRAVLGRELTKMHETYYRGTLAELHALCSAQPMKGEMTLVIAPRAAAHSGLESVEQVVAELKDDSTRPLAAKAKELALRCGIGRKEAYDLLQK
jgi:16S rRNA (cytidine1402-2'-O)-methyltransferase